MPGSDTYSSTYRRRKQRLSSRRRFPWDRIGSGNHLENLCGLAAPACTRQRREAGPFLTFCFGTSAPVIANLGSAQINAFMIALNLRLRPATLGIVDSDLRGHFRGEH